MEHFPSVLSKKNKRIHHSGRPMKGFVYVEPEGIDMDEDLEFWIQKCLDYNPKAKSSKKKLKNKPKNIKYAGTQNNSL